MFRWCKNSRTTDLEKTKSVVLNKTVKIDHLKFTSLTISPGTAAVTWLLIINLLLVQLQCLQRKSIMCFDHAPSMAPYFSQNNVPLQSGCAGQHISLLHWTEAWILCGNNSRFACSIIKTVGHKITRTVFSSDQGPEGSWNIQSCGILIGLWLETWKCASVVVQVHCLGKIKRPVSSLGWVHGN